MLALAGLCKQLDEQKTNAWSFVGTSGRSGGFLSRVLCIHYGNCVCSGALMLGSLRYNFGGRLSTPWSQMSLLAFVCQVERLVRIFHLCTSILFATSFFWRYLFSSSNQWAVWFCAYLEPDQNFAAVAVPPSIFRILHPKRYEMLGHELVAMSHETKSCPTQ